jgi:hypothetical protein
MGKTFAQPGLTYIDPALNNSRAFLNEHGEKYYTLVGSFKVIGTPYLFSEKIAGDMISEKEKAYNIDLSYNTYNQELAFYTMANPNQPLVKKPGELDSFFIHKNESAGIPSVYLFVYGPAFGATDKCYYQVVASGPRFNLYKRYKSDLEIVSSNIIQSELRQFNLSYEYYYTDSTTKQLKRLRQNVNSIVKEFKPVKDISGIIKEETFSLNPEEALKKAFDYLNQ